MQEAHWEAPSSRDDPGPIRTANPGDLNAVSAKTIDEMARKTHAQPSAA
jgi:hypothetical protein